MTLATALAAPVDEGMMLPDAQRPPRQSLMALTMGARPLVVQDAHETAIMDGSYVSSLTPMTTTGESSLAGAEKMIFLAPAPRCAWTFSFVRKAPVDSQMYSAPNDVNGISDGSRVCDVGVRTPSMTRPSSVASTVPGYRPWIESYLNWYAMYSFAAPELTSLRSIASLLAMMRATRRPMRPKPLMPPATAIVGAAFVARIGVADSEFCDVVNADAPVTRSAEAVNFILRAGTCV